MAKAQLVAGTTSYIAQVFIQDSSSTTGAGLSGLVFNTSSLTAYYHRDTDTSATAITLVTMTVGTFTSSGFKEIDATNMKGWYQLCLPNAALGSGAKSVAVHLQGATNMAPLPLEIELTAVNNQDAVRGGMTALPNAAAGANTGLPVVGTQVPNATAGATNGLFIAGTNAATTVTTSFTTTFTGNLTGSVASVTGLTASNLDAAVSSRMASYTQPTGFLAATFPGTVASPTNITAGTITTATNLTNAPTAGDFTATMKTSIGTAVAASAVASVTGAVGSIATAGIAASSFASGAIDAAAIAANAIGASEIAADAIGSSQLAASAASEIVTAVFARAFGAAYGSYTFDQLVSMMAVALLGKCSGMATATGTFRNIADSGDVIIAQIDAAGNRTAVTLTP